METIGRLTVALIALVLIGTGLFYAVRYNARSFDANPPITAAVIQSQNAAAAPVVVIATATPAVIAVSEPPFDAVGTIVYYVQQGVDVPYFFYTRAGKTYSKALEFNGESICVTSVQGPCASDIARFKAAYGSGPVEIQGVPDDESLLVSRISAAPA
jgi:hypothetical protein